MESIARSSGDSVNNRHCAISPSTNALSSPSLLPSPLRRAPPSLPRTRRRLRRTLAGPHRHMSMSLTNLQTFRVVNDPKGATQTPSPSDNAPRWPWQEAAANCATGSLDTRPKNAWRALLLVGMRATVDLVLVAGVAVGAELVSFAQVIVVVTVAAAAPRRTEPGNVPPLQDCVVVCVQQAHLEPAALHCCAPLADVSAAAAATNSLISWQGALAAWCRNLGDAFCTPTPPLFGCIRGGGFLLPFQPSKTTSWGSQGRCQSTGKKKTSATKQKDNSLRSGK